MRGSGMYPLTRGDLLSDYGPREPEKRDDKKKMSNVRNYTLGGPDALGVGIRRGRINREHDSTRDWSESDAAESGLNDREPI